MRIVFMGTPEFAVPSLEILIQSGHEVVGVITATDKMGGRGGKQLLESAVKKYAKQHNLTILQPPNLKSPQFQEELAALRADLQVVVAFRMLPVAVWDMPPIGTINLHGSLLPAYRGAAPINWAIINGETETGVTTFFLKHEIDTGDILLQRTLPIDPEENVGQVYQKLMVLGAQTVKDTVDLIASGDYTLLPQDESKVSKAPKIFKETCEIEWYRPAKRIIDFIRGLSPYPAAWTNLEGTQLKVFEAIAETGNHDLSPGTWDTDGKSYLRIACTDGWVNLKDIQLQGRKRMKIRDFLNGYKGNWK